MHATGTFQTTVDILHNPYSWMSFLVYLDDDIIFSKDDNINIAQLDSIFDIFSRSGESLTLKKFEWFTQSVSCRGHVVKPGRLEISSTHTESLLDL